MTNPQEWNATGRAARIAQARSGAFDLIIIGGGITGAGVAREAALRGLTFCLVDKDDFAFGTSSRSSKLAHGGIRYLKNGEFGLVRESTTERNWLRCHFPNLVRPLGFMLCVYDNEGVRKRVEMRVAVKLYDVLSDIGSRFKNHRRSRVFPASYVAEFEPAIAQRDPELGPLREAGFYYDTNVDDARLTVETIKESLVRSGGASVALNYAKVVDYTRDGGKVDGIRVHDVLGGGEFTVKGKVVVACGGIWTDEILQKADFGHRKIYPTKGVHVVVPNARLGNRNAFGIKSFDDGRFFFVLRRGNVSVIGTTDTDYFQESQDLDQPWCTRQDCDYLLRTVNRLFPGADLTDRDIIGTYAGIRPLIRQEGAKNASAVSREHEIFTSKDGVVAMAGGKLTTYRLMAEELLFHLVKTGRLPPFENARFGRKGFSMQPFLVGMTREAFDRAVAEQGLGDASWPEQLEYLHQQFGSQGLEILRRIQADPALGRPLLDGHPHCRAEIEFILRHEDAPCLIDVLCRRTEAQWLVWHHRQEALARQVARIMAEHYGWTDAQEQAQVAAYLDYVRKTVAFVDTAAAPASGA